MTNGKTEYYFNILKYAINIDIGNMSKSPIFYALVIRSNFKDDIFNKMTRLNNTSVEVA